MNGVANTIRRLTAACVADGHDLTVVTSRSKIHITDIPIKNFAPIGEFELPEYELQKLSFPPILQMIDYIQREGFTELIIRTPGPIGLTALLAAKMLGLRTSGIYHTDFPQYIRILTDDNFLETLTWNYMKWFYEQLDLFYVNSEGYRRAWIDRGIAAEKMRILPRGLDTTLFHPSRRDPAFWQKHGDRPGNDGAALRRTHLEGEGSRAVTVQPAMAEATGRRSKVERRKPAAPHRLRPSTRRLSTSSRLHSPSPCRRRPVSHGTAAPAPRRRLHRRISPASNSPAPSLPRTSSSFRAPRTPSATSSSKRWPAACRASSRIKAARRTSSTTASPATSPARSMPTISRTPSPTLANDPALREPMRIAARHAVEARDWAEAGRKFWRMSDD